MNKLYIWLPDLGCNARRKACRAALLHKRFATTQCAQSWRVKCACYLCTSPNHKQRAQADISLGRIQLRNLVSNKFSLHISCEEF